MTGKLAEYILVHRVYFLLLQMTSSIMVAASIFFSLRAMMTRPLGMVSLVSLIWNAFVAYDFGLAMYLNY
jgi:hypothetical protein